MSTFFQKKNDYTDNELITLSLQDERFFGILVDRFESKLDRYIRRITSVSREDRQDILQNVFMKAYINLHGFNTDLSCQAWLYRITHNQVIDWSRREKTKQKYGKYDYEDEVFTWTSDGSHFLDEIYRKEDQKYITKILHTLDIKYREVLVLKFIENHSYRDMSDILQKPEGTIATLINRAKKAFKKEYEKNTRS